MIYEKRFILTVGREAKIILKGDIEKDSTDVLIDFEFLIKDSHENDFHDPITSNHPQYWKLKKSTPQKAQLLQMEYSGVSRKQLHSAINEFKNRIGHGYDVHCDMIIEERIKYLKGVRISALNRNMLAQM
ncbi:hypothetical protein ACFP1I_08050 [Dyadobacter subterraneus]|uniref:Uncharacterized protein n=1 Tax=Dyadobacter subterraneus TaxID=2773304 RepID=A0ABR9WHT3_9BACT|nr:hypothetical protein [Dyadobacter subterraneus]MBE9463911.1 hypothetical protein [Dyadobacter subterraneus]